ncbi:MAG: carbohydrate kinase family protein [Candidatus Aenigmarchaeota archaeon]|nr:carbohydrate kinase family protein [Candidatus Aenigmarchaeota archaeon]
MPPRRAVLSVDHDTFLVPERPNLGVYGEMGRRYGIEVPYTTLAPYTGSGALPRRRLVEELGFPISTEELRRIGISEDYHDLVAVGSAVIDILYTPDGTFRKTGGAASTTAIRLGSWGYRTGFIGRIGNDGVGKLLLEEFAAHRVDTSRLRVDAYPTDSIDVRVTPAESHIQYTQKRRQIRWSANDAHYTGCAAAVYVRAGSSLFMPVAQTAKDSSTRLFVSLNGLGHDAEDLRLLGAARMDAVFGNEKEFSSIERIAGDILGNGAMIVVTRGNKGCTIMRDVSERSYPAYRVRCLDPTGAGDAFAAGFIHGYLQQWSIDEAAPFANACGALATTQYGARSVLPTVDEVRAFMSSRRNE